MADYVAYYRVSTTKQGQTRLGLDSQRDAVAAYVASTGGHLVAEHEEIESGASHSNRPVLAAALTECRKRRAVLLIAKLDRLARNVHFISGVMETGVDFIACDMPTASSFTSTRRSPRRSARLSRSG
jgi:DNA invertase Pin-like site-specific DNA recombinase